MSDQESIDFREQSVQMSARQMVLNSVCSGYVLSQMDPDASYTMDELKAIHLRWLPQITEHIDQPEIIERLWDAPLEQLTALGVSLAAAEEPIGNAVQRAIREFQKLQDDEQTK